MPFPKISVLSPGSGLLGFPDTGWFQLLASILISAKNKVILKCYKVEHVIVILPDSFVSRLVEAALQELIGQIKPQYNVYFFS